MITSGSTLVDLVDRHAVIICCGGGGVGKTTTAAAIALHGARRGRRVVVVTIDPARRLADALGLDALSNRPSRVAGVGPGELWAMMLDARATFDDVVGQYADSEAQRDRILANRFYRNISETLSGTQEYMAAEKLYDLHHPDDPRTGEDDRKGFDLVVVDTPPNRNALDFIDAPRKLMAFLDHRLYRLLTSPTRGVLRPVNAAAQAFVKIASRLVGAEVIADAVAFFRAFDGMEAGFRARADNVLHLLTDPATAFVLIVSPRSDTIAEAHYFRERLRHSNIDVQALIVNGMHPQFGVWPASAIRAYADDARVRPELASMLANLAVHAEIRGRELEALERLRIGLGGVPVATIPLHSTDIHDMAGLDGMRHRMFGG